MSVLSKLRNFKVAAYQSRPRSEVVLADELEWRKSDTLCTVCKKRASPPGDWLCKRCSRQERYKGDGYVCNGPPPPGPAPDPPPAPPSARMQAWAQARMLKLAPMCGSHGVLR